MNYKFFRLDKEKNIELFENGGWHFNNILTPKEISLKLRTFAHSEFSEKKFSDEEIIQNKIDKKIDLFNRGHNYKVVDLKKNSQNIFWKILMNIKTGFIKNN